MGTWNDAHGLQLVQPRHTQLKSPAAYDTNKTYIITTILHDPFLMQKSAEYGQKEKEEKLYGFCKDLADLITKQLRIKCKYF